MTSPPSRWLWRWDRLDDLAPAALYQMLALRQAVFVVEQACCYQDADGRDAHAWHLSGWCEGVDGPRLGLYLRAFAPGPGAAAVIGRVIVASEHRGRGLGRILMGEGLARLEATVGRGPVRISAQAQLEAFYGSLGFVVDGPGYDEDGLPHLPMVRTPPP